MVEMKEGSKLDFDKEDFAQQLRLAKGERSINRYGMDSGVDPGYISRLLRGLVDTAPSAAVIKKLAGAALNGVTVQELLTAAGYIDAFDHITGAEKERQFSQWKRWEKVIEEAALYNIPPEAAMDLIRSLGKSMKKIKK